MAIKVCILFSCIFVIVTVKADVVCPPPDTYAPCRCTEDLSKLGGVKLDCFERNLSDSNASNILDVFLSPDISPISILNLSFNQLTRIPSQIRSFPHLQSVFITHNVIESIAFGDFNSTGRDTTLNFFHNQLTTIAPGAFTGNDYRDQTRFDLSSNNLTRFESTVFQLTLEKMASYGGYPNAYVYTAENPFDCDDCHLAWLIRYNRHLLPAIFKGTCSNGTAFEDLNPNGFANCPMFVCPLGYDGQYADPLFCYKFYSCKGNTATSNDCPLDSVFNTDTNECEAVANVPSCGAKEEIDNNELSLTSVQ